MALDWTLPLPQDWYKMGLEDMGEPFVSSLKDGVLYLLPSLPLSLFICYHPPPQAAQLSQNTGMDCLGFLESTACFDLRAGTTSPLLGFPTPWSHLSGWKCGREAPTKEELPQGIP